MTGDNVELPGDEDRAKNEEKWIGIEGGMMKMMFATFDGEMRNSVVTLA